MKTNLWQRHIGQHRPVGLEGYEHVDVITLSGHEAFNQVADMIAWGGCADEKSRIILWRPAQTPHRYAEVIEAFKTNRPVQVGVADAATGKRRWGDYKGEHPNFDNPAWEWRVRPEDIELSPADILPVSAIRNKKLRPLVEWLTVVHVLEHGVFYGSDKNYIEFSALKDDGWEIYLNNAWQLCQKPAP